MKESQKKPSFVPRPSSLVVACAFGLESLVIQELKDLGYDGMTAENGRIRFQGDFQDVAICNIWLRTADRVMIQMGAFEATSFDALFEQTKAINWGEWLPENARMHVTGKSLKSQLFSVPDCQSIVKKAIVESMKKQYRRTHFPENGPLYKIEVALNRDMATLTVDTTGPSLHKRGYRVEAGEAPIKETLAAALVLLSRWDPSRVLVDPLCGSGTIPIEAAWIGLNIAPGLRRHFVSEEWPQMPPKLWQGVREQALAQRSEHDFRILGSDWDSHTLKKARQNAQNAGVAEYISFQKLELKDFNSRKKYGCLIANPPYGGRLGDDRDVRDLYRHMGQLYKKLDSWSFFVLTAHPNFEKIFGLRANKKRKLYNGRIQCQYYQLFGPLPPRH